MPRIEIIAGRTENHAIDVCAGCAQEFEEGLELSGSAQNMLNDTGVDAVFDCDLENAIVGNMDVEHPAYESEEQVCDCCGKILDGEDD
jgi:hypothetical protein